MLAVLAASVLVQNSLDLESAWKYAQSRGSHALLIQQNGKTLLERYSRGSATTKRMLASGTKSFTGITFAAAIDDGLVKWDTKVGELLPAWKSDRQKSQATLQQLISLQSGVDPGEMGRRGGGWNDAVMAAMLHEPGTKFQYGSNPFLIYGAAMESALKGKTFEQHLKDRILDPLKISVTWNMRTTDGKPQLAGGAAMSARDWATLGRMLLNGGVHEGKRIVSAQSLSLLIEPTKVNSAYGTSFWMGDTDTRTAILGRPGRPAPGVPKDLYQAVGAGSQKLMIIPSLKMVIVRMGPLAGGRQWKDEEFFKALL